MRAMTGAKGAVRGRGCTANSRWVSTGRAGTAKLAWGAVGGGTTVPGAGNMGRGYVGTGVGKAAAGQLDWDVSEGDQAVALRLARGRRWGSSPAGPVLWEGPRGLALLDLSFLFFPVFFQDESIPEVLLSPGAAKIAKTTRVRYQKRVAPVMLTLTPAGFRHQRPGPVLPDASPGSTTWCSLALSKEETKANVRVFMD